MVRLQPGRLVGQQRIRRGVRFVEAVVGELGAGFERQVGVGFGNAFLGRAFHEAHALLVHLRADLLAHGAAQKVGFAERVAGQVPRDLHHLFLIGDDAERRLEDRLQPRRQRVVEVGRFPQGPSCGCNRSGCSPSDPGDRAPRARSGPRTGRGPCRPAPAACPGFQPGTRRPLRRAGASRRSWRRPAAGARDRPQRPCSAIILIARSMTVSVLRPRKSNFTRPAASAHFMLNWLAGISDRGSR